MRAKKSCSRPRNSSSQLWTTRIRQRPSSVLEQNGVPIIALLRPASGLLARDPNHMPRPAEPSSARLRRAGFKLTSTGAARGTALPLYALAPGRPNRRVRDESMSQGVNRCLPLMLCPVATGILSGAENQPFRKLTDIPYAKVAGHNLLLDLYLPSDRPHPAPLAVFVHGGAWRSGSKQRMPLTGLVRDGFAVASADYRLTPVARFPAQIHDLKAAIRFLRAKQDDYGYDDLLTIPRTALSVGFIWFVCSTDATQATGL